MIYFIGKSHAAVHFKLSAEIRGFEITEDVKKAKLIIVCEDAPIGKNGKRNLRPIRKLVKEALSYEKPVILTSQVPPGFCRGYDCRRLYHQSETLRIKDALVRAVFPEQIIMGVEQNVLDLDYIHAEVKKWCKGFNCIVHWLSYEEAEFSKIAINMTLASQVDNTNRLAKAAEKVGAQWVAIKNILSHDKRIGPHSYLTPGRWQDSQHLLRDAVTLKEIENG